MLSRAVVTGRSRDILPVIIIACVLSSRAVVTGRSRDILPVIIIGPSSTSCTESVDASVKLECVANARSLVL